MDPAALETQNVLFGGRWSSGINFIAFNAVNPVTPYIDNKSGMFGSPISNNGTLKSGFVYLLHIFAHSNTPKTIYPII